MNFNLKHLVLSIVSVIFIMGSAAVADVTQLRGVGADAHNSRVLDENEVPSATTPSPTFPPCPTQRPATRRVLDENEGAVSAESVDANGAIVKSSSLNACPPRPPPRPNPPSRNGNNCLSFLQPNVSSLTCRYGTWYPNGDRLDCACTRNRPVWSCGRA